MSKNINFSVSPVDLARIVTWYQMLKALHPGLVGVFDQETFANVNGRLSQYHARLNASKSGENRPHRVKEQLKELDHAAVPLPEEIKQILGRAKKQGDSVRESHKLRDGVVFIGSDMAKELDRTIHAILLADKADRLRGINWFKNPFKKPPTPRFKLIHPDDIRLGDFIWRPAQGGYNEIVGRVVTIMQTPPQQWADGFVTFEVDTTKKFVEDYGTGYVRGNVTPLNVFNWQKEKNAVKIYKAF